MGLRDNIDPSIAAISVILIVITVAVLVFRRLIERRQQGESTQ
jgi:putative spermidine/putrescine transport system permease protein